MEVKGNHPLAEIIARKLTGIGSVPPVEQSKMVNRACKAAVEYHEKEKEGYENDLGEAFQTLAITSKWNEEKNLRIKELEEDSETEYRMKLFYIENILKLEKELKELKNG